MNLLIKEFDITNILNTKQCFTCMFLIHDTIYITLLNECIMVNVDTWTEEYSCHNKNESYQLLTIHPILPYYLYENTVDRELILCHSIENDKVMDIKGNACYKKAKYDLFGNLFMLHMSGVLYYTCYADYGNIIKELPIYVPRISSFDLDVRHNILVCAASDGFYIFKLVYTKKNTHIQFVMYTHKYKNDNVYVHDVGIDCENDVLVYKSNMCLYIVYDLFNIYNYNNLTSIKESKINIRGDRFVIHSKQKKIYVYDNLKIYVYEIIKK